MLSDHQDTEHFIYERSWEEIKDMLDKAERKKNRHFISFQDESLSKRARVYHMRNYKALEGVIKALRWTLGDIEVKHPLE